ncbi:MAG: FadR family transcriptional regulator [Mogibacterium sp.]|nr:FadR family transcriptional regulator [Mogibacterium sp.]
MNRKTLIEQVTMQLHQLIEDRYPPGSKIPSEPELTELFDVSRTTIRSAISSLVSKNVLEIRRGKGTYVTENPGVLSDPLGVNTLNPDRIEHDIAEISLELQPFGAELAALRRQPQDLLIMQDNLRNYRAELDRYLAGESDYNTVKRLDSQFHAAVIASGRNIIMDRLNGILQELQVDEAGPQSDHILRCNAEFHPLIYDAIERKDPAAARDLMLRHLSANQNSI